MAKKAEQNKVSDKSGITLEKNTIYDDNLLPPADELRKLNTISEEIVPWIMRRTEIEQDARIKFNNDRMSIAQKDFKYNHLYNIIALVMAFVIVLLFLGLSFYLIINGRETLGSVFVGGTLVMIVGYFLNTKNKKANK